MFSELRERMVVVWDVDFKRAEEGLKKLLTSNDRAADEIEKRWSKTKVGQDLIDQARAEAQLKAVARGATAGAVAVAGLAFALNEAVKAADFGAELQKSADKIGVTAEALQQLEFAAGKAEIPVNTLRNSLERLNGVIGAERSGTARKGVREAFAQLRLTPEDLKNINDAADLLPVLADRLGQIENRATQVDIARRLGIEDLLPLLRKGSDGIAELTEEYRALGIQLSNETVRNLAEANTKMAESKDFIGGVLRLAFAELAVEIGDVVEDLKEFVLWLQNSDDAAAEFMRSAPEALRAVQAVLRRQLGLPAPAEMPQTVGSAAALVRALGIPETPAGPAFTPAAAPPNATEANRASRQLKRFNDQMARAAADILSTLDNERHSADERADVARQRLAAEQEARRLELADMVATRAITQAQADILAAKDKEVFAARARELEAQLAADIAAAHRRADADLSAAIAGQLRSQAQLATTAKARADLNAQALAEEQRQARIALNAQLDADPNKTADQKTAELAAFDRRLANERLLQVQRDTAAVADEALRLRAADLDGLADILQSQLALATTVRARRELELRLLALADEEERARLETIIAVNGIASAEGQVAQKRLDALTATRSNRQEQVIQRTQAPLEAYADSAIKSIDELDELSQQWAAQGLHDLAVGFAEAMVAGEDFGDVLANVFRRLAAQLAAQAIEQSITGPLARAGSSLLGTGVSALFGGFGGGKASGGTLDPTKWHIVGERGPEILAAGTRGTVLPNEVLRAIGGVSDAQPNVSVTVLQPLTLDLKGAVMTEQLLGQMQALARGAAATATAAALGQSNRSAPARLTRYQQLGT